MKESHQQGKDERKIEEQVDTFFQYNPMSNPEYLKAYVQKNPNNKMAWYLLGKYYEQQHKPGKARYCFEQSGAIYEAFEAHEIGSVDMASAESDEAPFRETKHKDRRRIIAALILILAAGLLFPSSERFEQAIPLRGGQLEVADTPPKQEGSMKELPPMSPPRGMDTVIYIHDDMDSSELGDFLFKHTTGMNSEFGTAALIWSAWKPDAQGWIMGAGSH